MDQLKSGTLKAQPKKSANAQARCLFLAAGLFLSFHSYAQTSPPPSLGEDTKGEPAVDERTPLGSDDVSDQDQKVSVSDSLLGTAKIKESKRENGQRYLIELEHSTGSKQYIEENDSDGKIESTSNDIEETPNLPKWKLGSW